MRSNQQVKRSDRLTSLLEGSSQLAVRGARQTIEMSHLQRRHELLQGFAVPGWATALGHAELELGQRNRRNPDVANGSNAKTFDDRSRTFFDQIYADVRVEHQVHENARCRC